MIELLILIPLWLCWGSFLNVVAYRLVHEDSILKPRSYCPQCRHTLAWFDLIPLFSWIILKGRCRSCSQPISWLYPFIEFTTTLVLSLLVVRIPHDYLLAYFIFFSALIITIRTDLETMLISRFVSLFLVPLGFLFSTLHILPISLTESMLGAGFGYGILYVIAYFFYTFTGKEGMGQGDLDLLAFIGAFTGPYGAWISLLIGSTLGSLIGALYTAIVKPPKGTRIPFGPFLALGAICFVLFQYELMQLLFNI